MKKIKKHFGLTEGIGLIDQRYLCVCDRTIDFQVHETRQVYNLQS